MASAVARSTHHTMALQSEQVARVSRRCEVLHLNMFRSFGPLVPPEIQVPRGISAVPSLRWTTMSVHVADRAATDAFENFPCAAP